MSNPAAKEASSVPTEPRDRILGAAEELFAQRGYSAVGVRELAGQAGVNIAMINYYFGSKQGVLEELLNHFFDLHEAAADQLRTEEPDPECRMRAFVRQVIAVFRQRPLLVRIAMTELPLEATDLARFKAERIREFVESFLAYREGHARRKKLDPQVAAIRGSALLAMLTSHFLMKPILQNTGMVEMDEAFYRKLPEVLADLFVSGYGAVTDNARRGKYKRCGAKDQSPSK